MRILREPRNSLVKQYVALLATEGVDVQLPATTAVEEIARIAAEVNERMENIGARRLHTVMERLLDEISFDGRRLAGPGAAGGRPPTCASGWRASSRDEDLSRYIL